MCVQLRSLHTLKPGYSLTGPEAPVMCFTANKREANSLSLVLVFMHTGIPPSFILLTLVSNKSRVRLAPERIG